MAKFVSDTLQAPVMATIAVEGAMTRVELLKQYSMTPTLVDNIIRSLEARSWVGQKSGPARDFAGRRPLVAEPTDKFWHDYNRTIETAEGLMASDRQLYRDAVTSLRETKGYRKDRVAYKVQYSNYLGRTAYLGEHYDLAEMVNWFSGLPGWRALVTIEALRVES